MARPEPFALLLSSVAYLYSTITGLVDNPMSPIIANTQYGQLRGFKGISRGGRTFYEFLGIPYAKPPVGQLRFEPPEEIEPWEGVRNAMTFGSRCLQFESITRRVQGDEDCLFLNLFTPSFENNSNRRKRTSDSPYPVLVFFYGGLFMSGQSNSYRPKYFLDNEVVLVTVNYRLNSLGFLSTGDELIKGNMGLKDQVMALKWIKNNIKNFGGDPNKVTLVGESAGSVSAHMHILSPMSKGLFHRAISQSGSALAPWALNRNPAEQAKIFGKKLRCPTYSSKALVDCLKSKSSRRLARSHANYLQNIFYNRHSIFTPSIEIVNDTNAFLTEEPRKMLEEGRFNKVPWINGINSDEGLIYAVGFAKNRFRRARLNKKWDNHAPILFDYMNNPDKNIISRRIRDYYLKDGEVGMDSLNELVELFSDRQFFEDSSDACKLQSIHSPVYSYYYSYRGDFSVANILLSISGYLPENLDVLVGTTVEWFNSNILRRESKPIGVCHGDELGIFYNLPIVAKEIIPGTKDYQFSESMIDLWVSFAKNGYPSKYKNVTWDPVNLNTNDGKVMRLKLDKEPEMMEEPFANRLQFWKSLNLDNSTYFDNSINYEN